GRAEFQHARERRGVHDRLVRGDTHGGALADTGERVHLGGGDGLFEELDAVVRQRLDRLERLRLTPRAVRVQADDGVGAHLADRADSGYVRVEVARANLQLEYAIPRGPCLLRVLGHL